MPFPLSFHGVGAWHQINAWLTALIFLGKLCVSTDTPIYCGLQIQESFLVFRCIVVDVCIRCCMGEPLPAPQRVTSQKISKIFKTCFEKNIFLLFSKEYFPTKHHWCNLTGFWQWASPCVRRLLEILSWWPSFLFPFFPWNCVLILMRDLKFRLYEVRMFGLKNHRGKMLFFY